MSTKICKQCGELKPIEHFRKYYGGRKGHYNTCKMCEKINARYKYLTNKDTLCAAEINEQCKIEALYDAQRKAGLQPPRRDAERNRPLVDSLDDMIAKYTDMNVIVSINASVAATPVPAELQKWLTCDLTEEPDYYIEDKYEELMTQYRPVLRIGNDMQPVYDGTYKGVLEQILDRFYEYEESYWDKED